MTIDMRSRPYHGGGCGPPRNELDSDIASQRQRRILIVEDELGVRRLIETILERAGFAVDCAVTGLHALEKLETGQFDAVVLDLALPWLTGFDVLTRLREGAATADLPIIILTGSHVTDSQFDRYPRVGLVRKPFEARALVAAVEALL